MNKLNPPKKTKKDAGHALTKSVLGAVPFLGSAAIELFSTIVTPPIESRRNSWMEEVGRALQKLIEKDDKLVERLQNDQDFVDTLLTASQLALQTSQQLKLSALKNAVINSTAQNSVDTATKMMFMNIIDSLTDWHIRILDLFNDPNDWAMRNNHSFPSYQSAGLVNILESAFPELKDKREFYDLINKDLYNSGLMNTDSFHTTMSSNGLMQKRSTGFGAQFLKFIDGEN